MQIQQNLLVRFDTQNMFFAIRFIVLFLVFCTIGRFCFPKVGANGKVKESQISRMTDLLELAEIKNRILFDNEEADLDAEIDWNNSDKKIQKARCDSERYLEQALFM